MPKSVCIVGAGWAGLAAAVELCRHDVPVTVYESALQIGGRARTVSLDGVSVDNGQHLFIGAYQQCLSLFKTLGIKESNVFHRYTQQMQIRHIQSGERLFELKLADLISPLHLVGGMLACPSLNFKQKIYTLYRFNKLLNTRLNDDISVSEWLAQAKLPDVYVDNLLLPLCLAAMTTHPEQASAKTFQHILQLTFNASSTNTDLLIPTVNLTELFPQRAKEYIESHGGKVLSSSKLQKIYLHEERISHICINKQNISCDHLILATPAAISQSLLQPIPQTQTLADHLKQLKYEPITTVYLQYPKDTQLSLPMIGLLGGTSQWLFDRRFCDQAGLMSVVISAHGEHTHWDKYTLGQVIASELAHLYPHWPKAHDIQVIREKRACFQCHVDVDQYRPYIHTSIKNLDLCGDYVKFEEKLAPSLPSTLESAITSGVKCAQLLVERT